LLSIIILLFIGLLFSFSFFCVTHTGVHLKHWHRLVINSNKIYDNTLYSSYQFISLITSQLSICRILL